MSDRCNGSGQASFGLNVLPTFACPVCGQHVELAADGTIVEHGPKAAKILAAHNWTSNAELILDCHRLGYLEDNWLTLDPTFGMGTWWKLWKPAKLACHDKDLDRTDFRKLDYPDGHFDAIAYDPPYCAKGGRKTSGIKEMDDRYGQDDAPATPALVQELINDGLTEMFRLVRPRGFVLCKSMDYVSSGKLWEGAFFTQQHARSLGFQTFDVLQHVGTGGPQPPRKRQVHAAHNSSTLFVFRKPRFTKRRPKADTSS